MKNELCKKYGKENTDRLFSLVENPIHLDILIATLLKMNILYHDAFVFTNMYVNELRLLNLKCIFDNTSF
jgi:hypothetical protein